MMKRNTGKICVKVAAAALAGTLFLVNIEEVQAAQGTVPVQRSLTGAVLSQSGIAGTEESEGQEGGDGTQESGTDSVDQAEQTWPQGPSISGESGVVMEVSTGTILYEKNMDTQHYPASITKIMTALLALENCQMDEMVTVPHDAVYMDGDKGSHIALDEGEQLTMEQCLYAIMLESANDAAYAVAAHIGGTVEGFADMMNKRAEELGCRNTHFTNPHGLPDENHLTSAYDMALITREALSHDMFRQISGTLSTEIPATATQKDQIPLNNHHDMLRGGKDHYEGAFAGKTGYTVAAKNTLVTCAARAGMELICVTMKTGGGHVLYPDTAALLDFGFDNFALNKVETTDYEQYFKNSSNTGKENMVLTPAEPDGSSVVVLPKGITCDALSTLTDLSEEKDKQLEHAFLTFQYAGHTVGNGSISRTVYEKPAPQTETTQEIPEAEKEKKVVKWWAVLLWILLGAVVLFAGLVAARVIYLRIYWEKKKKARRQQREELRRRAYAREEDIRREERYQERRSGLEDRDALRSRERGHYEQ